METSQKRQAEAEIYRAEYRNSGYRMGEQRKIDVERLIRKAPKGELLDIGAGRGETLAIAERLGFSRTIGTEVVPELLSDQVLFGYAHSLPFADKSFDVVTCFDVMEHLLEDDLIQAVKEMVRIARKQVILSCSEIPSSQWGGGRDLHISARPAAQWEALIKQSAPGWIVTRDGEAGGSPAFVVIPNE